MRFIALASGFLVAIAEPEADQKVDVVETVDADEVDDFEDLDETPESSPPGEGMSAQDTEMFKQLQAQLEGKSEEEQKAILADMTKMFSQSLKQEEVPEVAEVTPLKREACITMTLKRLGMQSASNRTPLSSFAGGYYTMAQAAEVPLFRVMANCIAKLSKPDLEKWADKKLIRLPKPYAVPEPEASAVLEMEPEAFQAWVEAAAALESSLQEQWPMKQYQASKKLGAFLISSEFVLACAAMSFLLMTLGSMLSMWWRAIADGEAAAGKAKLKKQR